MRKILGILCLLIVICVTTALLSDNFVTAYNIENLLRRSALFGILGIGAAFVIITGGIDLSIGSMVGLVGVLLPIWLGKHAHEPARTVALSALAVGVLTIGGALVAIVRRGASRGRVVALVAGSAAALFGALARDATFAAPRGLAIALVVLWILTIAGLLGYAHGLFVTRIRLQPFVVTLCGLLLYRGIARGVSGDRSVGFGNDFEGLKTLASGKLAIPGLPVAIPIPCVILIVIAVLAALFLNRTIWGRYLRALGNNEEATRLSGVNTGAMITLAYVICAFLAGFGGLLFVLDLNLAQPAGHGNFYELYAIAAAVLGGCSLRGGEGTITGVIIGAVVMQVLYNSINLLGIPTTLEFAIIGAVILAGVTVDELVKRFVAGRRVAR